MNTLKGLVRLALSAAVWRGPNARLVLQQVINRGRNERQGVTDDDHLIAAAQWLERAQDATGDGGFSGRYRLRQGWSSSYPETTGYLIPTLLALAEDIHPRFYERARQAVGFLLRVQLPSGAFPGGEISGIRRDPSVFNSAQIIHGLVAWHRAQGNVEVLEAARRAGNWLVSLQEDDGSWRRHLYDNLPTTYTAHASCWLAELGQYCGEDRYLQAAARHLDWILKQLDHQTGWFDRAGFTAADHADRIAVTHVIAYTIWGVLFTSTVLGRADGVSAARRAAEAVARRLELSRWLPGVLDHRWRGRSTYACLTGNAQMALIWLRLYEQEGDSRLLNAALKAIDLVKVAHPLRNINPGIRGGLPGSDPVWGDYIHLAFPNWAAKYFIDALLTKKRLLTQRSKPAEGRWRLPDTVPRGLPEPSPTPPVSELRVVLLTSPGSAKVSQLVKAWSAWGFRPSAVVIEHRPQGSRLHRLRQKIYRDGFRVLWQRLIRPLGKGNGFGVRSAADPNSADTSDPLAFCSKEQIPVVEVGPLESPEALQALQALAPDLAIHAGAGILRKDTLAIPRLGTLNAHMGLLPYYRGTNVAEWAAWHGDLVGCSVHLIAPGIDTGDILCVQPVPVDRMRSRAELRRLVNETQICLLGEVTRYVLRHGQLPPRYPQRPEEGVQFFEMHSDLLALLEARLAGGAGAQG